jgi:hypothetical protein|tara:strand:- start:218 stop:322 length:105 start_codon:yes stop_codon:yes gene_type:complete
MLKLMGCSTEAEADVCKKPAVFLQAVLNLYEPFD